MLFHASFLGTVNFQHAPLTLALPALSPFPSVPYIVRALNYATLWDRAPHFPVRLLLILQVSTQMFYV